MKYLLNGKYKLVEMVERYRIESFNVSNHNVKIIHSEDYRKIVVIDNKIHATVYINDIDSLAIFQEFLDLAELALVPVVEFVEDSRVTDGADCIMLRAESEDCAEVVEKMCLNTNDLIQKVIKEEIKVNREEMYYNVFTKSFSNGGIKTKIVENMISDNHHVAILVNSEGQSVDFGFYENFKVIPSQILHTIVSMGGGNCACHEMSKYLFLEKPEKIIRKRRMIISDLEAKELANAICEYIGVNYNWDAGELLIVPIWN